MRGFLGVSTVYSTIIATLNTVALVGAIWASEHDTISIGVVYLAVTYTFTVSRQLWEMNSIMRNYNRIMGDAHDMTEILALIPSVVDKSKTDLTVKKGEITFTDVSFAHTDSKELLFDHFSLAIADGERIGLVGRSGSGKTTLTRMLLRFSDITDGTIAVDGQDISQVTQKSLRENIAYVPQEPMLFHRSLYDNIAYGKPNATKEEVHDAAAKANALEFIEKLPEGFETTVGERGVKLSGGQRQRIAIARAILKDAPILVLDEATSALDSESEKLIQDALAKLMKGRTSIVVAHRLSTISKLDRIIVLENGEISEQGSHQQLLKDKGTYAKLWAHQSGGFIEE
jgi:ATP-binding cassette subfamily B protein